MSDDEEQRAPKRRRGEPPSAALPPGAAWHARFPLAPELRNWLENVGNVLTEGRVEVVDAPDFQGLRVNGVDGTRVAMVQAQLRAQILTAPGPRSGEIVATLGLKLAQASLCLRSARSQDLADLWAAPDSDAVTLQLTELDNRGGAPKFELKTLALPDEEPLDLSGIVYVHAVVVDLGLFQRAARAGKDHRASLLTLSLRQGASNGWFLVLSFEGPSVRSEFVLPAAADAAGEAPEADVQVIRTDPGLELDPAALAAATVVYEAAFMLEYLHLFTRTLAASPLRLFLAPDRPLRVQVGDATTEQLLQFYLAPCQQDV